MARILVLLSTVLVLAGCITVRPTTDISLQGDVSSGINSLYYAQISAWQGRVSEDQIRCLYFSRLEAWQQKVEKAGWNTALVREIVADRRDLTRFEMELEDHWDTPKEFVDKDFQGDCEDIAIFMLAALKSLGYPHDVKIIAVKTSFEDHALLKVAMPEGQVEVFETIRSDLSNNTKLAYTTIVEFDERSIFFPAQI